MPHFIDQDFTVVNTSDYLVAKIPLESGSYTIRALAAPNEVADALQIAPQSPTLYCVARLIQLVKSSLL
ncbi:GntR family transcriptional regulator [marine sediment metagenome]|uniref:GntR family transcriptional regulator n=1 Tax=marine sediment metagenome TaxID=412755 RepID=A0A1B6NWF2_9ZZZZ